MFNGGFSNDNQIMIGTTGTGYDYKVDWGDGSTDEHVTGDIVHTYAAAGTYTVTINGRFPQIHFAPPTFGMGFEIAYHSDHNKLISIEQWGDIEWKSMNRAFANCKHLIGNATDSPDLSKVLDMSYMFSMASLFNQDISDWDVSNVTDMSHMFMDAYSFNQYLNNWDVSNVTNMESVFHGAWGFDQDLSNWNASNVTNMKSMFQSASNFNQLLSNWDVSNVTNMESMFEDATNFNQTLNSWDVSNVSFITHMFYNITLSTENYDALLLSWSNLPLQSNLNFNGGNSQFSNSSKSARDVLTDIYGWTVTDGGSDD